KRPPGVSPPSYAPRRRSSVRGGEDLEVFADDLLEAHEERPGDEGVADGDFVEVGELAEEWEVVEIEVVAGVHAEAAGVRDAGRLGVDLEGRLALPALEGAGVGLGVELDAIGAELGGPLDGPALGVHEERDADAGVLQALDGVGEATVIEVLRPAGLARDLVGEHGYERALGGLHVEDHAEELLARIALDVELHVGPRGEHG